MPEEMPPRETPPARRILLVDCDQFFVQVARLQDPEGIGKERLLLVGGSPSGRGVVTSASYEAREYGVRSAMPMARAVELCPEAVVVGVPRAACSRKSREVRKVLTSLSPIVQAASIDEFYLDLSGTERLFDGESLQETAERIRHTVLERTGISVSVGGGTARIIAKLATDMAKPAGSYVVPPGEERSFMKRFDLKAIPGVGPALLEKLEARGLRTVADLLPVDRQWLVKWFGENRGRWLYRRARGIDQSPVSSSEPRKSISSERTFPRDIADADRLRARLREQVESVTSTLRRHELRARTVTVKLRASDFTTRQSSHTLPEAVESDRVVFVVAEALLSEMRRERKGVVRLLGVALTNLRSRHEPIQLGLFGSEGGTPPGTGAAPGGIPGGGAVESDQDRILARVLDELNVRFGDGAVRRGGAPD